MSNVYLHSKNNNNSLINLVLILFVPLFIIGIYKNSILVYKNGFGLFESLKPIIFLGISLIITLIIKLVYKEKYIGNNLLENLIIAMIAPPGLNIIIYSVLIIILNFAREYLRFNKALVFAIISIVIMMFMKNYSFMNVYEAAVEHNYSLWDLLMGKGYGGVFNTFLIGTLVSLCILCANYIYKRGTSVTAIVTYYILITIYSFISGHADPNLLVNPNVIFAMIFIVPISIYSPYSRGAGYIYGVLIGILTFALSFFDVNLGVYISIFILNLLAYPLDSFIVGKSNKNLIETL